MSNIMKSDTEGKPDRTASVNWTRLKELAEKAAFKDWGRTDGTVWAVEEFGGVEPTCCGNFRSSGECCGNAIPEFISDPQQVLVFESSPLTAEAVFELVNAFPAILEEVERLRAALRPFVHAAEKHITDRDHDATSPAIVQVGYFRAAQAALTKEQ
jgi:hypothetical protein